MSTQKSSRITRRVCKDSTDSKLWNEAILDGERLLKEAHKRARELRAAIKVCKRKRDAGESFPGQIRRKQAKKAA